ncbi:uncharacterized protein At5g39865-like [Impatiens glandulifera]|uniref:uncharacterized protein At5g39865-like n=1 Tax=Impatiens glandulifera TaxID=253017 RepID=UPI001FB098FB|nr:uncharacterized protein At5g39865-like [Impatiens glandulifera]
MAGYGDKSEFSGKPKTSPYLNRSLTMESSVSNGYSFSKKPHLNNLIEFERNGSIKKLHNSSIDSMGNSIKGKVKKLCSLFESSKSKSSSLSSSSTGIEESESQQRLISKLNPIKSSNPDSWVSSIWVDSSIRLRGTEDRVVLYFTSLRSIRRTWEDCCTVRMIIKAFRIFVDERDISMDSAYRKELQSVLGLKVTTIPQVFIKGKYIGGADMIKQLNEIGELGKMLRGLPLRKPGHVCDTCGDMRFIPCSNCSGSRKVYDDDEEQLKKCLECNENGLIRCPTCCCS